MSDCRYPVLAELNDKTLRLNVRGDCMRDVIANGACIHIKKSCYWPGDIIVFVASERIVMHRLIGAYWRGGRLKLLTQADHGRFPDPALTGDRIIGKVISVDDQPLPIPPAQRLYALLRFLGFILRKLTGIR